MVGIYIGLDVHKSSVYVTAMDEEGNVCESYGIENTESALNAFRSRYLDLRPEIALEVSTSGKYIARKLRDMGFSVHLADPSKLSLIFMTAKKNDREDSYKLSKLLRLKELPEVHLPSRELDDLRSIVRHRKSIGEELNMLKNRVHAILTKHGITIHATDIFGRRGIRSITEESTKLPAMDRIVLSDLMDRISDLKERERMLEVQMAAACEGKNSVRLLMTIPGINLYSASAISSEIDDVPRFPTKEKLAAYAGLVPRQDQSGNRDIKGHITKHGPSLLRFILVTAAHVTIRYSKKMKAKYLSLVRRLGKNRAIVAIARALLECIYVVLTRNIEFEDNTDSLTERKRKVMSMRAKNPRRFKDLEEVEKIFMKNRDQQKTDQLFS